MIRNKSRLMDQQHFIRNRLFDDDRSQWQRYRDLVVGPTGSFWSVIQYEVLTCVLGGMPGAVGLWLRQRFYPTLFQRVGRGVIFGRHLTIRNARSIILGDRTVIDDYCVLDGRGSDDEGICIGDRVIVNRGAVVVAKSGDISIGSDCDVGAGTSIISQGSIHIGQRVSIAGDCKIGGGSHEKSAPSQDPGSVLLQPEVAQRYTKGPIVIEDDCVLFSCSVLDGVHIGQGALIGSGAVVREDVPDHTIAAPQQRLVCVPRDVARHPSLNGHPGDQTHQPVRAPQPTRDRGPEEPGQAGRPSRAAVQALVTGALEELNEMRPADEQLSLDWQTPLASPSGNLDSMDLVNLIVAIEQRAEQHSGVPLNLASGNWVDSDHESPFATVASLVDYVQAAMARGGSPR